MKYMVALLVVFSLCGCAGNPPAWWNPSGAYTQGNASAQTQPVSTPAAAPAEPEDQPIDGAGAEDYEEISLSSDILLDQTPIEFEPGQTDFPQMPPVPKASEAEELKLTPSVLE